MNTVVHESLIQESQQCVDLYIQDLYQDTDLAMYKIMQH